MFGFGESEKEHLREIERKKTRDVWNFDSSQRGKLIERKNERDLRV